MYTQDYLKKYTVLHTIAGSTLYGTAIDGESDRDEKVCFLLPASDNTNLGEPYLGEIYSNPDIEYMALLKVMRNLIKQDTNTLDMINAPSDFVISRNCLGLWLQNDRKLYVSQRIIRNLQGMVRDQENMIKQLTQANTKTLVEDLSSDKLLASYEGVINNFEGKITDYDKVSFNFDDVGLTLGEGIFSVDTRLSIKADNVSLKDLASMVNEVRSVMTQYSKQKPKFSENYINKKLRKTQGHVLRMLYLAITILKTGEYNPVLPAGSDILADIRALRAGDYSLYTYYKLYTDLKKELDALVGKTKLPDNLDVNFLEEKYKQYLNDYNYFSR